jgi:hypothetical protein
VFFGHCLLVSQVAGTLRERNHFIGGLSGRSHLRGKPSHAQDQQLSAGQGGESAGHHGAADAAGHLPYAQPISRVSDGDKAVQRSHNADAAKSGRGRPAASGGPAAQSAPLSN